MFFKFYVVCVIKSNNGGSILFSISEWGRLLFGCLGYGRYVLKNWLRIFRSFDDSVKWLDVVLKLGFEDEKLFCGEFGVDFWLFVGGLELGGVSELVEDLWGLDGEVMFFSLVRIFFIVDEGFEGLLICRELGFLGIEVYVGNKCVLNGIKSRVFMMWVSGGLRLIVGVV